MWRWGPVCHGTYENGEKKTILSWFDKICKRCQNFSQAIKDNIKNIA